MGHFSALYLFIQSFINIGRDSDVYFIVWVQYNVIYFVIRCPLALGELSGWLCVSWTCPKSFCLFSGHCLTSWHCDILRSYLVYLLPQP